MSPENQHLMEFIGSIHLETLPENAAHQAKRAMLDTIYPQTPADAQYSIPFTLGAAVAHGKVGLRKCVPSGHRQKHLPGLQQENYRCTQAAQETTIAR